MKRRQKLCKIPSAKTKVPEEVYRRKNYLKILILQVRPIGCFVRVSIFVMKASIPLQLRFCGTFRLLTYFEYTKRVSQSLPLLSNLQKS